MNINMITVLGLIIRFYKNGYFLELDIFTILSSRTLFSINVSYIGFAHEAWLLNNETYILKTFH